MRERHRTNEAVEIVLNVPLAIAPALRSVVEEMSHTVGQRLEKSYGIAREQSLTNAAEAMGIVRAAVNAKVPQGDRYYGK